MKIIVIALLVLATIGTIFYYRTNRTAEFSTQNTVPTPSPTATPSAEPTPKTTPPPIKKTPAPSPTPWVLPQAKLPDGFPIFAGAEIAYGGPWRTKSCAYGDTSKFCEVNIFTFHIKKPGLQVEEVHNWYISNPNPAWVFSTPTFTQANSGKIVNGDTYYIIRIAFINGNQNGVQLVFEGPYEQK